MNALGLNVTPLRFSAVPGRKLAPKPSAPQQKPVTEKLVTENPPAEKPVEVQPEPVAKAPEPKAIPRYPHGGFFIRPKTEGEPSVVDLKHLSPEERRSLEVFQVLAPGDTPDLTPEEQASLKAFRVTPRDEEDTPPPLPLSLF